FATFRDKLRPGQKETWRVTVRGPKGEKLDERTAELLTYMYDRSLDFFGAHSPPSPLSLYPSRSEVSWARANLGVGPVQWVRSEALSDIPPPPSLHGDALIYVGGYAIGGMGGRYHMAIPMPPPAPPAETAGVLKSFRSRRTAAGNDND